MNGTNRVIPSNGTNRIEYMNGGATASQLMQNGTSRIHYMNGFTMNGYTLNGYTLNALGEMDEADYEVLKMLVSGELGEGEEMNALGLAAIAGLAKKVVGGIKKGVSKVKGFVSKVKDVSAALAGERATELVETAQRSKDMDGEGAPYGFARLDEFQKSVTDEFAGGDQRGYLIGTPPFEPWKGKWWTDKQTPVVQKAGVAVGALVLVDALTGGNIVLKRVGIMKGKNKKKR